MKKVIKVIFIIWLIIIFIFLAGYLIYESNYIPKEDYTNIRQPVIALANQSCYNVTFNFETDENLKNNNI